MDNHQILRVLLVEDNENESLLIRRLLSETEGSRFEVEWVTTYDAALATVERNQNDVYLIDYYLDNPADRRTGLDLMRDLVARGCKVPMILLTYRGDRELDMNAMKAGASDYLDKRQLDLHLLERSIRYCVQQKRVEAELAARARQQAAVARLGQHALEGMDLSMLMQQAVSAVAQTIGVEYCKVMELLPDGKLLLRAGVGWKGGVVGRATVGSGSHSPEGYTITSGGPVIFEYLATEQRFTATALLRDHGVVSGMSVIIQGDEYGGSFGVLDAGTRERRKFTEDDVHFLQSIANVLGAAIERNRAEDARRESENRLQAILDNTTAVISVKDADGRFLVINRRFENLFHVNKADVIGKTEHDFFPREMADALRANDLRVLESAAPIEFEEIIPQDDGPHTYISAKVPMLDAEGKPHRVCGISTDITDRKTAQEALARYDTARRFMDDVSHEFRTPLTVIKEFSSILRDGLAGELTGEQREYLDIVGDRVDDLNHMVNDMLDIGRLDAGLLRMCRKSCRVEDILTHVRPSLERKAEANKVVLESTLDDELPDIYCDPEKIGRVVVNLVVNAIKFSTEGGRVCISARQVADESALMISVTDDGPGIGEENLRVIFERFKQIDGTVRASTKGFGLGLNIAKELVQMNLGEITVTSQVGRGSTFSFTVPTTEPSGVVGRFLKQIEQRHDAPAFVSLATARLADDVDPNMADDVDEFLQHSLMRNELAFRYGPHTWLLLVGSNRPDDLRHTIRRTEKARTETNRNRPSRSLPTIDLEVVGTWRLDDERNALIAHIEGALEPMELVHA